MQNGALTAYLDVPQVMLYVFWAFFFTLVFWLRKEDRREGYPLESDPSGRIGQVGLLMARPKIFRLRNGDIVTAPNFKRDGRPVAARRVGPWPGAPLVPTGNPLVDGVGPAAWAERADRPDQTFDNRNKIVPSRIDPHYAIASRDPDPRGMPVVGADGKVAGTVRDIWVDRSEHVVRYLELDAAAPAGTVAAGIGPLLVPLNLAKFRRDHFKVKALLARQFAEAPRIKSPDSVTFLEEDRICAYFAGGHLYATPGRTEAQL